MYYDVLSVGDNFPITTYSGVSLCFRDGQAILTLNWRGIKSDEVRNVKSGVPQFALYHEHHMIFFCFRLGTLPWMDCSYTIHLEKDDSFDFDAEVSDDKGYSLQIFLVDAVYNKVKAKRIVELPVELSQLIRKLVLDQKQSRKMGKEEVYMLVEHIYDMSSTEEMVDLAKERGNIW